MFYADVLMEEYLCTLAELLLALGGEVLAATILCTHVINLGVSLKIVFKTLGNILSLWYDADPRWHVSHDAVHEQWIVGAAKDDGIDEWILAHQLVDTLLYKVVGTRAVSFVGFYDGSPEWTCYAADLDVGMEFSNLQTVALAADGSLSGKYSHMA